jgi:hypothetical protein
MRLFVCASLLLSLLRIITTAQQIVLYPTTTPNTPDWNNSPYELVLRLFNDNNQQVAVCRTPNFPNNVGTSVSPRNNVEEISRGSKLIQA